MPKSTDAEQTRPDAAPSDRDQEPEEKAPEPPPAEESAEPVEVAKPPRPSRSVGDTVALVRKLGELESCDDAATYEEISDQIAERVSSLLESKNCIDAYRALLVYCRHSADRDVRPAEICAAAPHRLARLLENEDLLDFVIDYACTT